MFLFVWVSYLSHSLFILLLSNDCDSEAAAMLDLIGNGEQKDPMTSSQGQQSPAPTTSLWLPLLQQSWLEKNLIHGLPWLFQSEQFHHHLCNTLTFRSRQTDRQRPQVSVLLPRQEIKVHKVASTLLENVFYLWSMKSRSPHVRSTASVHETVSNRRKVVTVGPQMTNPLNVDETHPMSCFTAAQ